MLRERCRAFAEALQTVNILKDVARTRRRRIRSTSPRSCCARTAAATRRSSPPTERCEHRAALATLMQLAWRDLDGRTAYLLLIPRRAVSIRLFCVLPLLFAYATLRDLTRIPHALARREVVKISRAEVKSLTLLSFVGVLSNRGMASLVSSNAPKAPGVSAASRQRLEPARRQRRRRRDDRAEQRIGAAPTELAPLEPIEQLLERELRPSDYAALKRACTGQSDRGHENHRRDGDDAATPITNSEPSPGADPRHTPTWIVPRDRCDRRSASSPTCTRLSSTGITVADTSNACDSV